ncbi:Predicted pyrophosphatase or phosphodiesterase, AlkP superfamily [Sinomicrobium oceani]|uniref:Predicted pyrophosphatase or phosphodiesterase, AlkP superfamily n=1 Tax=Sinomicrobium oceani TaxID=1150368 RepID=A0A1K1NGW1_9FLAO|nr:alkaline phosphatase PafA [Sinomicrobium oceani]SFW33646.1 Predicted pyrophosphatase or phosphodiesterase, AlkP superfamily [Sinomicrobium oceani]
MRKSIAAVLWCTLAVFSSKAQTEEGPYVKPKLVVGIVVDQMRYDYITRFWEKYGNDGIRRLVNDGYNCRNNHYNYVPTYTGPGHTSVYTGTTPAIHGIIANDWYDKELDQMVYCAQDDSMESVGTASDAGKMSPHRMKTTTVTDQLRLATELRGKVIGVALKDRGAILPAGHAANAAYWFHGKDEGKWITSSYYMKELPEWVEKFNTSGKAKSYVKTWNTLYDIETYAESGPDDNAYEGPFKGEKAPVFPHELKKIMKNNGGYDILKSVPYGNSMTVDFALAAIEGEALGQDDITDFLAVSFSATDYVGHRFGVNSKEVQDTYLRLDKDIARLLSELDEKVGKGEYTVFLTADHAAVQVPSYLQSLKIPAGYFDQLNFTLHMKNFAKEKYGVDGLISNISNFQIFIDHKVAGDNKLRIRDLQDDFVEEVMKYKDVEKAFAAHVFTEAEFNERITGLLQRGYNQKRSGDVLYVLAPAVISYPKTGSTHGSALNYDTHTPLLFFGKGIRKGKSTVEETHINDIAPTIAALLGIAFPSGTTGYPVHQALITED